jgi:hypothetical protein
VSFTAKYKATGQYFQAVTEVTKGQPDCDAHKLRAAKYYRCHLFYTLFAKVFDDRWPAARIEPRMPDSDLPWIRLSYTNNIASSCCLTNPRRGSGRVGNAAPESEQSHGLFHRDISKPAAKPSHTPGRRKMSAAGRAQIAAIGTS